MSVIEIIKCVDDLPLKEVYWILDNCREVSIDTETTGLNPLDSELKLIQIKAREKVFLINEVEINGKNDMPNLVKLLESRTIKKIFHNAVFDIKFLMNSIIDFEINNVICTKISSKILTLNKESSSLKYLLKKHLNVEIDKSLQTSNWAKKNLSISQIEYAINDVEYLNNLWEELRKLLIRENKYKFAKSCFKYIPTQSYLELNNIDNIFKY